jgi:hypothetical protein
VLENRVQRRMFKSERVEVTEGERKMHNGEPFNLYSLLDIIRFIRFTIETTNYQKKGMGLVGHISCTRR